MWNIHLQLMSGKTANFSLKNVISHRGTERGFKAWRYDTGRDYTGAVCNEAAYCSLEHVKHECILISKIFHQQNSSGSKASFALGSVESVFY